MYESEAKDKTKKGQKLDVVIIIINQRRGRRNKKDNKKQTNGQII